MSKAPLVNTDENIIRANSLDDDWRLCIVENNYFDIVSYEKSSAVKDVVRFTLMEFWIFD